MKTPSLLRFTHGNAKLPDTVMIFSLPTGFSCPGADTCLCKSDRKSGRLTDGPNALVRCYAASQEAAFPTVRLLRWYNFDKLRRLAASTPAMYKLLHASVLQATRRKTKHIRIHGAGDFFSSNYFAAWMQVAQAMPNMKFYAYTKSLVFWTQWLDKYGELPSNLKMVASRGGKFDKLIDQYALPEVVIVSHPAEAEALGIEIDDDDTHAQQAVPKFALLLHGAQKAGSKASADKKRLREEKIPHGYGVTGH